MKRLVMLIVLLAVAGGLAGCGGGANVEMPKSTADVSGKGVSTQ